MTLNMLQLNRTTIFNLLVKDGDIRKLETVMCNGIALRMQRTSTGSYLGGKPRYKPGSRGRQLSKVSLWKEI